MEKMAGNERRGRLTPAAAIAVAAGAAGTLVSCCALLLLRFQPALLAPFLILSPALVAACVWLVSHRAIRTALRPAASAILRLAEQDFFSPTALGEGSETAELAQALDRCRSALAARHGTMRAHAAVARLMGAGIGRLAQGDYGARIDVELPAPYDTFACDFNAAMDRLAATLADMPALRADIERQADALGEAAQRLGRRAEKLAGRIEADLRIIDVHSRRDAEEALKIALHTMEGVGVATRRNMEAAERFADMARSLRDETGRLAMASAPAKTAAAMPVARNDIAA